MNLFDETDCLSHHGILGMKWGVRRYQNKDGTLTPAGRVHYGGSEKDADFTMKRNARLQTLSPNADRTKDVDYFYAAFTKNDKDWYKGIFAGRKSFPSVKQIVPAAQFSINNKLLEDVNVASEQSGSKVMSNLYNGDPDFKDFITNPERLRKATDISMSNANKKYKPYADAIQILDEINKKGSATPEQLETIYKLFNFNIPADGRGDESVGIDVANQRQKFFDTLKKEGYGAVLDTNDAYYSKGYGRNVEKPVIMFDMDKIIQDDVRKMPLSEIYAQMAKESYSKAFRTVTGKVR